MQMNSTRSAANHSLMQRITQNLSLVAKDTSHALDVRYWLKSWPRFSLSHLATASQFYDEHGWVIIRNVFSAEQIANFRSDVKSSKAGKLPTDLLMNPLLGGEKVILNDHVLAIVSALLKGNPAYFGDSTWFSATEMVPVAFHKDNADRENPSAPDWENPYTLIRMGIYLQDHARHSGGLALRDCSHNFVSTEKGRPLAVPTEVGDVVFWTLRMTHSGFAIRPKMAPGLFVPVTILNAIGKSQGGGYRLPMSIFRAMEHPDRMSMFATFGLDDHHMTRYLTYLKTREYAIKHWAASPNYTDEIRFLSQNKKVKIIEMQEEARQINASALNVSYKQL